MDWDFTHLRKTVTSKDPIREVFRWWASLPASCRPSKLAKNFPHIVNNLALCWDDLPRCEKYLGSLIFDPERPLREGFPPPIGKEILILYNYRTRFSPATRSVADQPFTFDLKAPNAFETAKTG